jgi:nickel transport protein
MIRLRALPALLLLVAAPAGPARAHEVLHVVERGRAIALRATYADGEPLAYAQYEVFSPADPRLPHQKGRTDRAGWLAFVPDAPGAWRVKVADATGHGVDATVDADAAPSRAAPTASQLPAAAFVLRPLVGLAAIGALFAALVLWRRRGAGSARPPA